MNSSSPNSLLESSENSLNNTTKSSLQSSESLHSLQILSILSLDRLDELREILIPKKYYCIEYKLEFISQMSLILFKNENIIIEHLYNMIGLPIKPCSCCFVNNVNNENWIWTKDEFKNHMFLNKHYKFDDVNYIIRELEVI